MKRVLLMVATGLLATSAMAGDVAAGKAKAAMCAGCHGAEGIATIPQYPNLAGQNAAYLVEAMKAYKNKKRSGGQAPMMYGMTAALSDADIENLAAFYASFK